MTKLLLLLSQGNYFCSLQRWAFTQKNDEAKVPFTDSELGLLCWTLMHIFKKIVCLLVKIHQ